MFFCFVFWCLLYIKETFDIRTINKAPAFALLVCQVSVIFCVYDTTCVALQGALGVVLCIDSEKYGGVVVYNQLFNDAEKCGALLCNICFGDTGEYV